MISGQPLPLSLCGMSAMVLRLAVMSSPTRAVAARRALHENAVLVAQRRRQPVDLGLGGEHQLEILVALEEALAALGEVDHVLVGVGLGEAQHRHLVPTLAKPSTGAPATLSLRLSGRFSSGKARSIAW